MKSQQRFWCCHALYTGVGILVGSNGLPSLSGFNSPVVLSMTSRSASILIGFLMSVMTSGTMSSRLYSGCNRSPPLPLPAHSMLLGVMGR